MLPALFAFSLLIFNGCANLQQLSNLKLFKFDLDHVSDLRLAGIDVKQVNSLRDLKATDILRVTQAVTNRALPLTFTVHVGAEGPAQNPIATKLSSLEWTLFIENREAISGLMNQSIDLPNGQRTLIPVQVNLNAIEFFQGNAQDILNLVKNALGKDGAPVNLRLAARPTLQTPIGAFRFPQAIDVVSRTVGNP